MDIVELSKEITKGYEEWKIGSKKNWSEQPTRGIGTKSYVCKRIDLLREKLLEIKKEIKED